jgi:hypothetical protein
MNIRRLMPGIVAAVILCTGGVATGIALANDTDDAAPAATPRPAVLASGLSLLPSASATDWVEYASTVAVVTVVDEQADQVDPEDLERGEGTIDRRVVMRLDERLWSRPSAAVPDRVTVRTEGWAWGNGDPQQTTELGFAGRPRFEVGRQYLIALAVFPGVPEKKLSTCEDIDPAEASLDEWGAIGEFAAVPVSNDIVGAGEFEGTERSLEGAFAYATSGGELEGGNSTLRGQLLGREVHEARALLEAAASKTTPKNVPAGTC